MNTQDPIESNLERLAETVSLRASEKDMHRQNLMTFMKKGRMPIRSPYAWLVSPSVRYVSAFALLLIVSGTGVVSAAEGALPGHPLYAVKLKVTEPARSALTLDAKEKTEYEVERADRRLKEFALLSSSEDPDSATTELIADALSQSLTDITEDIVELSASGDADEALETNADLQSLLSAHQLILARVEEKNPELAEEFDAVSDSVDAGIANTENVEQAIENSLDSSFTEDAPLTSQSAETEASLEDLRAQLLRDSTALDTSDQETVAGVLVEVDEILTDARTAQANGDRKEAYLLYMEADQRLNELKTLIEADHDLGIGVIDVDAPE